MTTSDKILSQFGVNKNFDPKNNKGYSLMVFCSVADPDPDPDPPGSEIFA